MFGIIRGILAILGFLLEQIGHLFKFIFSPTVLPWIAVIVGVCFFIGVIMVIVEKVRDLLIKYPITGKILFFGSTYGIPGYFYIRSFFDLSDMMKIIYGLVVLIFPVFLYTILLLIRKFTCRNKQRSRIIRFLFFVLLYGASFYIYFTRFFILNGIERIVYGEVLFTFPILIYCILILIGAFICHCKKEKRKRI